MYNKIKNISIKNLQKGDIVFRKIDNTYCIFDHIIKGKDKNKDYYYFTFLDNIGSFSVAENILIKIFSFYSEFIWIYS